jgi:hypothetical protein
MSKQFFAPGSTVKAGDRGDANVDALRIEQRPDGSYYGWYEITLLDGSETTVINEDDAIATEATKILTMTD